MDIKQHNIEIQKNLSTWKEKVLLHEIYKDFYSEIISRLNFDLNGRLVELGSGVGNLKKYLPGCICTDIFPNPWIDQVEDAYNLSFKANSVSNLILFDVFHHLEFPGDALNEFSRVLKKNGRVIIFDPCMSLTGLIVFGLFHHEPIGLFSKIFFSKNKEKLKSSSYYASQGNTYRIFRNYSRNSFIKDKWELISYKKFAAFSYVASGGYSRPQLYPTKLYKYIKIIDKILNFIPLLFATRLLVVLQKK